MKTFLLVTAALVAFTAAPGHAELRNGFWAVDNVGNCKVAAKIYGITMQDGKIRFENVATGSLDIENVIAAGERAVMTETVLSVRANAHGHAVGTQWEYHNVTSDLINVERNGKTAYWIVRCS
jgi:hypothetical protein